jgi:hypothetical protein
MIRFLFTVLIAVAMFFPTELAAEEVEYTTFFSGTFTMFHDKKDLPPVLGIELNGIIMSDDERFNNMTYHCEAVMLGLLEKAQGYQLCTNKDLDGDIFISDVELWSSTGARGKYLVGSGKWKGIQGSWESQRLLRNKPGQAAMPGTFQGISKMKATFELPPK